MLHAEYNNPISMNQQKQFNILNPYWKQLGTCQIKIILIPFFNIFKNLNKDHVWSKQIQEELQHSKSNYNQHNNSEGILKAWLIWRAAHF